MGGMCEPCYPHTASHADVLDDTLSVLVYFVSGTLCMHMCAHFFSHVCPLLAPDQIPPAGCA